MTSSLTLTREQVQSKLADHRFRPDVQGLRAVAVGAVLIYHAGAPFLPGGFVGVDVFFVISGFLITSLLLRESLDTGRINIGEFYARRARRILPAATLVLIMTTIATITLLPRTRWDSIGSQIVGSALYYVNWEFAADTTYLNADVAPSPLQHFWTLAVEEQFYVVWPLLLLILLYRARPRSGSGRGRSRTRVDKTRVRRFIEVGVLIVTVPSLAWSIYLTSADPAPAYFVTTTRLWELGIGAAIAVFAARLSSMPKTVGYALGGLGLGAIVVSCVTYTATIPFPGYAALLPTLGAAAVIVGGMGGRDSAWAGAILTLRPLRWTGDISYSLYLWHWPMIVIGTYLLGGELQFWQGVIIITMAFIPSWLCYRFVETPLRDWESLKKSTERTLSAGLVLMLVSALAGIGVVLIPDPTSVAANRPRPNPSASGAATVSTKEGAALLAEDPSAGVPVDFVEYFRPSVTMAASDNPVNYSRGCHQEEPETELEACVFGNPESDYVVALVGDSHAAQWTPALSIVARDNGWRLEVYTKSNCPLNSVALSLRGERFYRECYEWNEKAIEKLTTQGGADHVIVSSSLHTTDASAPEPYRRGTVDDGLTGAWKSLEDAGIDVTVILDNPQPRTDIPECVAAHPRSLTDCAVPRDEALENSGYGMLRDAAERSEVAALDMTEMICPEDRCAAIIGSVLVYRDTNHLTATYSASLASSLETALRSRGSLEFR